MIDDVKLLQVASQPIAAVRRQAARPTFPQVIPEAFDEVWDFVRATGTEHNGINVVTYRHTHDDVFDLECGVQVSAPFTPSGAAIATSTPSGLTATATHVGPYHLLRESHAAIHQWCRAHGKTLAGPSWEVYDHWDEDPSKLRTSIFYLLSE
jgi:effector-binding domain-containing protein